jgi:hypothetical protein
MDLSPPFAENNNIIVQEVFECAFVIALYSHALPDGDGARWATEVEDEEAVVTDGVDVSGVVIVDEDHDVEAAKSQDGGHRDSVPAALGKGIRCPTS